MSHVELDRSAATKPRGLLALVLLSMLALVGPSVASAREKAEIPSADVPGSADEPLLGRYSGSVILVYERRSLGKAELPLGKLEPVPNDSRALRASSKKTVEGLRTHFLYYVGKEATPLEVVSSYQQDIKTQGGRVLYECKEQACGGSIKGNFFAGGPPGMMDYLYPLRPAEAGRIYKPFSSQYCAMSFPTNGLQVATVELAGGNAFAVIAAYTAGKQAPTACKALAGGTFVSVDVVDKNPRKSRIVNVDSAEIARALQGSGKIALYGIYFDVDRADVKSESDETLEQIAKLMKEKPGLKLMVVGHTDNTGNFDTNMDLSQRRAAAVVEVLRKRYGIRSDRLRPVGVSYAAPVASNKTENGRTKNRRVELVEQ